jgi:hypothetical protein
MAEYFLNLNRERTMESLEAALARGRKGGRHKKLTDADLVAARAVLKEQTISVGHRQAARRHATDLLHVFPGRAPLGGGA